MDYSKRFGERLSELMTENGNMNCRQLGENIEVSDETIRAWKKGIHYITLIPLIKLADYFKCSIEYLIGRSDDGTMIIPKKCPPFYQRLREVMKEKSKTSYMANNDEAIFYSNLTKWKKGISPNVAKVIAIADYLGVTVDYLIGRDI